MNINLRRNLAALSFGINTNVVISAIDIDPITGKDNTRYNQAFKVSIAKINDKGKKIKESTISLGFLPDVSSDKMFKGFTNLINRITSLLECYLEEGQYESAFDNIFVDIPSKKGTFTCSTPEDVANHNWREEQIYEVFDRIASKVDELLKDHIGINSKAINAKLVFNNKGYITAPSYGKMFEVYTDDEHVNLQMTRYDQRTRTAAGATAATISAGNTNPGGTGLLSI